MPDPTRFRAYLARTKDQEKDVIAVPDGAGRALCVSFDKHWTYSREWDELHIIAPLAKDEGNDDELDPLTQEGLGHVLQQLAEAKSEVARWEQNYLDADTKAHHATVEADDLKAQVKSESDRLERQAATISELQGSFLRVERERDAAEYAEAEMERERDEWKARAEAMARDRDDWRDKAYSASEGMRKAMSRAEAAEVRTTPAVTRAQVEVAIKWPLEGSNITLPEDLFQKQVDEVWSLVSGSDPLLDKALEFAALADWELTDREAWLLHKVATHVLGQEDRDA